MIKQTQQNFSSDVRERTFADTQVDQVKHPLIKQILTLVIAEESNEMGSNFGEGGGAG